MHFFFLISLYMVSVDIFGQNDFTEICLRNIRTERMKFAAQKHTDMYIYINSFFFL